MANEKFLPKNLPRSFTVWIIVFFLLILLISSLTNGRKYNSTQFVAIPGGGLNNHSGALQELRGLNVSAEIYYNNKREIGTWIEIENFSDYGFLHMYVLTMKGDLLPLSIQGNKIDLKILAHEIAPKTGKYFYWKPIISFPLKPHNGKYYQIWEIDIMGRYLSKNDFEFYK